MHSKVKIIFAALIFSAYCCSPKGDGTVSEVIVNGDKMYVFSLNELKPDIATISMSSLLENCTLVQLESIEEAYFKPGTTTVTDNYIGIRSEGKPYMLFDRSGKFLCSVGFIGNGPGEWTISLYDDIIDDKNELIYLSSFMSNKILVYNTSGKFLKNIVAPHRMQKPKMYLSDGVLTVVHMPFGNDRAIAFQFDVKTGEVLKELAPPAHLTVQNFEGELFSKKNVPNIFDFIHTSSDTLYHFDVKNNRILPFFKMTYNTSDNIWKTYFQFNKDILLTNVNVFDDVTERYVYKGSVATDLKSKTSSWFKVVNDYYGNIPAMSFAGRSDNGYWVYNIQPEELIDSIEKRLAQSDCTESDRQVLNKTLSTLKEGANNVVFIGKLKSEVNTKLW
jgi:hypothetical protein